MGVFEDTIQSRDGRAGPGPGARETAGEGPEIVAGAGKAGCSRSTIVAVLFPVLAFAAGNFVYFLLYFGAFHNVFALIRGVYNFSTLVFPAGLAAYSVWFLARGVNARRPAAAKWAVAGFVVALVLAGVRVYATHVEPNHLRIRTVQMNSAKGTTTDGATVGKNGVESKILRILHISDIQCDRVGRYDAKVFQQMRDLKPDLILFTGDLLQPLPPASTASELPRITALLETLHPPLGLFGVGGDVDWRIAEEEKKGIGGMRYLDNDEATVKAGGIRIRIFGLSLAASRSPAKADRRLRKWFPHKDPFDFTIVMGHAPDYVLAAKDLPIDLCLAGHTHGGQVRIPWFGPLITLSSVPRRLARGFHTVGDTRLNVSAGIGCEHAAGLPAIRFNCPPEMTLINVRFQTQGSQKGEF